MVVCVVSAVTRGADTRDYTNIVVARPGAQVRTVSNVMVETMVSWGLTHVFGMVGHSNLGLADAIRTQEAAGELTFIGVRHEGAAAFACSGNAKLTGRPAACPRVPATTSTIIIGSAWIMYAPITHTGIFMPD